MKFDPIHYHDYLKLDSLLASQTRRSEQFGNPAHDEWLFITVHQVYELWFFQILQELRSVEHFFRNEKINERDMGIINHRMNRILTITKQLNSPLDILETMTPHEFLDFRDYLYPASGFQSGQFRLIEVLLGLKNESRAQLGERPYFQHLKEPLKSEIIKAQGEPNLFDGLENWLSRTPFLKTENFNFWKTYKKALIDVYEDDVKVIESNPRLTEIEKEKNIKNIRDFLDQVQLVFNAQSYEKLRNENFFRLNYNAFHAALFISLYRDEPILQAPFQLLNILMDIDECLTSWRYRHALMAHRMLGRKIGTGGSSGTDYLKSTAEKNKIFGDLFNISSYLIPKSKLPNLSTPATFSFF